MLHGGVLHGESWKRIAFPKQIMDEGPAGGLSPLEDSWIWTRVSGGMNGDYRLLYFGEHQPIIWWAGLPEGNGYMVEIIDTWNMTISPASLRPAKRLAGMHLNPDLVSQGLVLPGKPYLAIRIRKRSTGGKGREGG